MLMTLQFTADTLLGTAMKPVSDPKTPKLY